MTMTGCACTMTGPGGGGVAELDAAQFGTVYCGGCGRTPAPPCPRCGSAGSVGAGGWCATCGMLTGPVRDHLAADFGPVAAAVTDRGLRHHRNEDAMWLAVRGTGADVVVCDGVSASVDPDVASQTAADTAGARLALEPDVRTAILAAKEAVAALVEGGDPRRATANPACTIVAAAVRGSRVEVGWIGDSRAYWLPATGPAEQLTEDDSWVTHVVALGADPAEAMRDPHAHVITGWLGADAGPEGPHTGELTVAVPGHLVLCTDGLWNYLPDPRVFGDVVRACLRSAGTPIGAARALVEFALGAGGADNITVAVVAVPTVDL